ncbi:MAG: SCO family protein [Rhizomicrobium sp.]|jgi:protein SCO1/2
MIRIQTVLFALAAALAVMSAGLIWYVTANAPTGTADQEGVSVGGPFTLTDQDGHRRSDRDLRGHYALLYFGYTFCPDVCPTTLQTMADALAKLGPQGASVTPVFITIDPERDTPAVLKKYLSEFGPRFVGLTGSLAEIARVAHGYRVYFAKHPAPGGGYSVDHSSVLYLLGPDGKLVTVLDATPDSNALAAALRTRL